MIRVVVLLCLLLGIAACDSGQPPHQKATPALWEITGPDGERGWLFATIHALPEPVAWRSTTVTGAMDAADLLVVEASGIDDPQAIAAIFAELAQDPDQPPLSRRVAPARRAALAAALARGRLTEHQFAGIETWAAALTIARAADNVSSSANGIDKALLRETDLPVAELEGARRQLGIFDQLPEREQRDLLDLAVEGSVAGEDARVARAWAAGDMTTIEALGTTGLLADPELRAALLTRRNARWAGQIERLLRQGQRPFVAVGAAHLVGDDGVPALLAARGLTLVRRQ